MEWLNSHTRTFPEYVEAMAINYLGVEDGKAYAESAVRDTNFVVITITPTKIIAWNYDE